jgi:hypothetical protein
MFAQLTWYLARSAGLLAWALVTASVVWGLLLSTRAAARGRRPRPAWVLDLHRFLGGLAVVFTAVHVAALLADSYVHFDLVSVLVPFAGTWHPGAVAWGIVGMWLLLAVELTSLARRHLPRKAWRLVHGASFPLFVTATVHGLTAGTDAGSLAFVGSAAAAILVVAGLTGLRIDQSRRPGLVASRARSSPAPAGPPVERPVDGVVGPWPRPAARTGPDLRRRISEADQGRSGDRSAIADTRAMMLAELEPALASAPEQGFGVPLF